MTVHRLLLKSTYGALLAFAIFLEAAVLYTYDDPGERLVLGLVLLGVIAWMISRTRVVEAIGDLPIALRRRQFLGMRSQVMQLLDEIRRLNWMALDRDRGVRGRDEATREMDAIETRLQDLVGEIRRVAGEVSSEPEALPLEAFGNPTESEASAPPHDGSASDEETRDDQSGG